MKVTSESKRANSVGKLHPGECNIYVPENNTFIQLNVSGKTVKEAGEELECLGFILKLMANFDDSYTDAFTIRNWGELPKPMMMLHYEEWGGDETKEDFSSNSIITGYVQVGDDVGVRVNESFMKWARTDKPIDEFCKTELDEMKPFFEQETVTPVDAEVIIHD